MICRDQLEGSIPSCDNSSVIVLSRNDLNLTGILPSWVGSSRTGAQAGETDDEGRLPALELLELRDNVDLSGTVPGVWGSALPKLEILNLHSSGLTGTFPGKTTYMAPSPYCLVVPLAQHCRTHSIRTMRYPTCHAPLKLCSQCHGALTRLATPLPPPLPP